MTPSLQKIMDIVNNLFNVNFNGILINRYKDGKYTIGRHSDEEKHLSSIGVLAISYGAVRKFRIKDKKTKKIVIDVPTKSLHAIHMAGNFQKEFTHEIPAEKRINEIRYSFTFREHKDIKKDDNDVEKDEERKLYIQTFGLSDDENENKN